MNDELRRYIAAEIEDGKSRDEIRRNLLAEGWNKDVIDAELGGGAPPAPQVHERKEFLPGRPGGRDSTQSGFHFMGMKIKKEMIPVVSAMLIVVGILMASVGYTSRGQDKKFLESAKVALGTVKEIESGQYDPLAETNHPDLTLNKDQVMYRPKVTFTTEEGRELIVSGKWRLDPNHYSVGQEVEVAYDPDNILDRRIGTEEEVSAFSQSLITFGWLILAPGVLLALGYRARFMFFGSRDVMDTDSFRRFG
jgi:hypothetical protein